MRDRCGERCSVLDVVKRECERRLVFMFTCW